MLHHRETKTDCCRVIVLLLLWQTLFIGSDFCHYNRQPANGTPPWWQKSDTSKTKLSAAYSISWKAWFLSPRGTNKGNENAGNASAVRCKFFRLFVFMSTSFLQNYAALFCESRPANYVAFFVAVFKVSFSTKELQIKFRERKSPIKLDFPKRERSKRTLTKIRDVGLPRSVDICHFGKMA